MRYTPPVGTVWAQPMPTVAGALWRPGEAPEVMAGQGGLGDSGFGIGPDPMVPAGAHSSRIAPTPASRISGPVPVRAPAAALP